MNSSYNTLLPTWPDNVLRDTTGFNPVHGLADANLAADDLYSDLNNVGRQLAGC